jgi:hypothetical protein
MLKSLPKAIEKSPPPLSCAQSLVAMPSSVSFSVSEKLARYGSSALSAVEHLALLVGKESIALSRASFLELRQFLPLRKAEALSAA